VTFDPVQSLARDWQQLARTVLPARLRAWAQSEPALSPFREPRRLIAFLRGAASPASKDAVLRSLVRIARDEPLAARVVLEAIAPGLTRLAERVIFDERDRDELWALILAHAWQQIRSYPLARRPSKIAANLILETRRGALAAFTRERRSKRELPPQPLNGRAAAPASGDVETLLGRGVAAGAITADEAELILQTRIDEVPLRQLAAERDLAYHTLKVRRIRAEKRLLIFLGAAAVTFRGRKAHWRSARAVGATRTGRITATRPPTG
jgi:DNA-directed RNA polymerase specialized sigma24 family protein